MAGIDDILGVVWERLHETTGSIGTRGDATARFEELFHAICMRIEPTLFLEIGAFEASMSQRIAASLPETGVYAFEANPFVWAHFRPQLAPAVNYISSAVGAEVGDRELLIPRELPAKGGRELAAKNRIASLHRRIREGARYERVQVRCTTIDEFVASHASSGAAAIWMDVEGAAADVLLGARKTLSERVAVACIELENRARWEQQWLDHEVAGFMGELGFLPLVRDRMTPFQYNQIFLARGYLEEGIERLLGDYIDALIRSSAPRPGTASAPQP